MLSFLFFNPDNEAPLDAGSCAEQCLLNNAVELNQTKDYWHGSWESPNGARALIDCGDPGLEEDHLHPPRSYPGWRELPLRVQIPLLGPHWYCSEALGFIDELLASLPDVGIIDCDDPELGEDRHPGPLERSASLDRWCELMTLQGSGRLDLRRMSRLSSMALWRYRCELATGEQAYPEYHWPMVHVLGDSLRAYTAILWQEAIEKAALPPIDLLVLPVDDAPSILLGEHILTRSTQELEHGACRIIDKQAIAELCSSGHARHCACELHPLDDSEWTDCS